MKKIKELLDYNSVSQSFWISSVIAAALIATLIVTLMMHSSIWIVTAEVVFVVIAVMIAWFFYKLIKPLRMKLKAYRIKIAAIPPEGNQVIVDLLEKLAVMGRAVGVLLEYDEDNDDVLAWLITPLDSDKLVESSHAFQYLRIKEEDKKIPKNLVHLFVENDPNVYRASIINLRDFFHKAPSKQALIWITDSPAGLQGGLAFSKKDVLEHAKDVVEYEKMEYDTDDEGMVTDAKKRTVKKQHVDMGMAFSNLLTSYHMSLADMTSVRGFALQYGSKKFVKEIVPRFAFLEIEQVYGQVKVFPPFETEKPLSDSSSILSRVHNWIVARGGVGYDKTPKGKRVALRPNSIIFGGGSGYDNPGVVWARHISQNYTERLVVLDFDGGADSFIADANEGDLNIVSVVMDGEDMMDVINLFQVPPSLDEEVYWSLVGVGAAHLERMVRAIYDKNGQNPEALNAILTLYLGAFLYAQITPKVRPFSPIKILQMISSQVTILNVMQIFRDTVNEVLSFSGGNSLNDDFSRITQIATSIRQSWQWKMSSTSSIYYSRENLPPMTGEYIPVFDKFSEELMLFATEPNSYMITMPDAIEEHINAHIVYIKYQGPPENVKSRIYEWLFAGALLLRDIKANTSSAPVNLLVNGMSQIPEKPREHVLALLKTHLRENMDTPTHNVFVTDSIPSDFYGQLIGDIHDMWVFRSRSLPQKVSRLMEKIGIRDSVAVLPPKNGYLLRLETQYGTAENDFKPKIKTSVTNVVTGLPTSRDATRLDDGEESDASESVSALERLLREQAIERHYMREMESGKMQGVRLVDD